MNNLQKLLNQYCSSGVEYKTLGELGKFYSGLSGKSKEDFRDGNAKFITYLNVFNNIELNLDVSDSVKIKEGEKQNLIQFGDVLFTGSSETPDECGMSSVLTKITDEKLYLNSFCFIFRFDDSELVLPSFSKYLFRSENLRKQIIRTASGVTRFNVSKAKMAKVRIPIPPIEVQQEIVLILDNFTGLISELNAELTARQKQYEYYMNELLKFGSEGGDTNHNIQWRPLGEIAKIMRGKRLTKNQLSDDFMFPVFHGGLDHLGYYAEYNRNENTTMVINVGASAGTVGYCKEKFWSSDGCYCIEKNDIINNKYIYYYLKTQECYLKSKVRYAGIPTLDAKIIENIKIPLPSISEQERIVNILDRFDKLCNDISEGLPAEIAARQKQYEYYRDKLISFDIKS